jgi:hypothetical protein
MVMAAFVEAVVKQQKSLGYSHRKCHFRLTLARQADKLLGYYPRFYRGNFIKMNVGGEFCWIAKAQARRRVAARDPTAIPDLQVDTSGADAWLVSSGVQ